MPIAPPRYRLTAILMWSLLAVLTVATGKIPAFPLAAIDLRDRRAGWDSCLGPSPGFDHALAAAACCLGGRGRGLFGYHALYFRALRLLRRPEAAA